MGNSKLQSQGNDIYIQTCLPFPLKFHPTPILFPHNHNILFLPIHFTITNFFFLSLEFSSTFQTSTGEFWAFDGGRSQLVRNGLYGDNFGAYWSTGDIIGIGLDLDGHVMVVFRNGKILGNIFSDISTRNGKLSPILGLARKTRVVANFGKEPGFSCDPGFYPLHIQLSDKEIDGLMKMFHKYRGKKIFIYFLFLFF